MSWLSTLGNIAKIAAPIAGAPFTGGMSLSALPGVISSVGGVLGQGAANSQAGRENRALLNERINAGNNAAQLDAAKWNQGTGATRMGQIARADVLANMQDAPKTGDPRIDKFGGGGLRPSAFGADTRGAANEQKRQALLALMNKTDQVTPTMTQMEKPGLMEKIGGVAGIVGGLAGALNPGMARPMNGTDIQPFSLDKIAQMRRDSPLMG